MGGKGSKPAAAPADIPPIGAPAAAACAAGLSSACMSKHVGVDGWDDHEKTRHVTLPNEVTFIIKIIMLGASASGAKTSLCKRYISDE